MNKNDVYCVTPMKKLILTLIVAIATVCGFAQEKILDNI